MATDRPDIWNVSDAFFVLSGMFSYLAGLDGPGSTSCGGFSLYKYCNEEGEELEIEYALDRQVLTFTIFDESETLLTDWTTESALSNIGLNVPEFDPSLDDDDEL